MFNFFHSKRCTLIPSKFSIYFEINRKLHRNSLEKIRPTIIYEDKILIISINEKRKRKRDVINTTQLLPININFSHVDFYFCFYLYETVFLPCTIQSNFFTYKIVLKAASYEIVRILKSMLFHYRTKVGPSVCRVRISAGPVTCVLFFR